MNPHQAATRRPYYETATDALTPEHVMRSPLPDGVKALCPDCTAVEIHLDEPAPNGATITVVHSYGCPAFPQHRAAGNTVEL